MAIMKFSRQNLFESLALDSWHQLLAHLCRWTSKEEWIYLVSVLDHQDLNILFHLFLQTDREIPENDKLKTLKVLVRDIDSRDLELLLTDDNNGIQNSFLTFLIGHGHYQALSICLKSINCLQTRRLLAFRPLSEKHEYSAWRLREDNPRLKETLMRVVGSPPALPKYRGRRYELYRDGRASIGKAVIFSIKFLHTSRDEYKMSDQDVRKMKSGLRNVGFQVSVHENCSEDEINQSLESETANLDAKIFMVVLDTDGIDETYYTRNEEKNSVDRVPVQNLLNAIDRLLPVDVVKVAILQMCRRKPTNQRPMSAYSCPCGKDNWLVASSTGLGLKAYRGQYLSALGDSLSRIVEPRNFREILTGIREQIAGQNGGRQKPETISALNKEIELQTAASLH